jgi:hypothetical protein
MICSAAIGISAILRCAAELRRFSRSASLATISFAGIYVVAFAVSASPGWTAAASAVVHGHHVTSYEAFEQTREETGIYLAKVSKPGQVLQTCVGWPAFEDESVVIDETCPLATRKPVAPPLWGNAAVFTAGVKPFVPPGSFLVKAFVSPQGGASWIFEFKNGK